MCPKKEIDVVVERWLGEPTDTSAQTLLIGILWRNISTMSARAVSIEARNHAVSKLVGVCHIVIEKKVTLSPNHEYLLAMMFFMDGAWKKLAHSHGDYLLAALLIFVNGQVREPALMDRAREALAEWSSLKLDTLNQDFAYHLFGAPWATLYAAEQDTTFAGVYRLLQQSTPLFIIQKQSTNNKTAYPVVVPNDIA